MSIAAEGSTYVTHDLTAYGRGQHDQPQGALLPGRNVFLSRSRSYSVGKLYRKLGRVVSRTEGGMKPYRSDIVGESNLLLYLKESAYPRIRRLQDLVEHVP